MKSFLVLSLSPLALAAIFGRAPCTPGDNCARAVTGTVAGDARSVSRVTTDCSSFQRATVYPSTTTVTVIATTSGFSAGTGSAPGTVSPSSVPAYAQTACSSGAGPSVRFASACSCAGVMSTTTTAPTPTATVFQPQACTPGPYTPAGSSDTYTVECGTNYQGFHDNIVQQTSAANVDACVDLCENNAACGAVVFYRVDIAANTPAMTCFLLRSKLQGGSPNADPRVDSAFKTIGTLPS